MDFSICHFNFEQVSIWGSREMRELVFRSGSRELAGRLFQAGGAIDSGRGVLFVHGQGSSQNPYKHRAEVSSTSLQAICLTFNLSGHGEETAHSKEYSVAEHLEDVIAAFDALASQPGVDLGRIGVCGASYGAYLTALLVAERTVSSVILRAPSLVSDHQFPDVNLKTSYEFDSLTTLAEYLGDILIIQSGRDEVIPESNILAYLNSSARAHLEVIPEALHALKDPAWDERFIGLIVNWFSRI
jgi:uncharacterized protein